MEKEETVAEQSYVEPSFDPPEEAAMEVETTEETDKLSSPSEQPLSQQAYMDQLSNFIHHLLKAFPDETFPIWIFTSMESPAFPSN